MYLGQLQAGAAAVQSFQRGVDLLQRHKAQLTKSKAHRREAEAIDLQVSTALCSMAELYTTDLWSVRCIPVYPSVIFCSELALLVLLLDCHV